MRLSIKKETRYEFVPAREGAGTMPDKPGYSYEVAQFSLYAGGVRIGHKCDSAREVVERAVAVGAVLSARSGRVDHSVNMLKINGIPTRILSLYHKACAKELSGQESFYLWDKFEQALLESCEKKAPAKQHAASAKATNRTKRSNRREG